MSRTTIEAVSQKAPLRRVGRPRLHAGRRNLHHGPYRRRLLRLRGLGEPRPGGAA